MPDKEFKRTVTRMLKEIQDNMSRQLNEIRKILHDVNEKFNKDLGNKILEMKNSVSLIKETL